jgi:hypothetical protein
MMAIWMSISRATEPGICGAIREKVLKMSLPKAESQFSRGEHPQRLPTSTWMAKQT